MKRLALHFIVGDINVIGGVESVTKTLSQQFIERGAKVSIHSLYSGDGHIPELSGVEIFHYHLKSPEEETNLFLKIKRLMVNGLTLREKLSFSESRPFCIFQGFYIASLLPFLKTSGFKAIVCEHNTFNAIGRLSRFVRRLIYFYFSPQIV